MQKQAVVTSKAPAALGPYSAGVVVGNAVHVSGQLGLVPETGAFAGPTIEEQTRQSLTNIRGILEAAGASMAGVAEVTVLLAHIEDFGAMNEAYAEFFEAPYPSRACFQVAALPKGGLVEIQVVAYL